MPEQIGIKDIMKPDYGDPPQINDGEMPVFWACGVTPQSVVATVKPEFCITHYPGCMLVTDRKNIGVRDHVSCDLHPARRHYRRRVLRNLRPFLTAAVIERLLVVLGQIGAIFFALPAHALVRPLDLAVRQLEQHVLDRPDVAA